MLNQFRKLLLSALTGTKFEDKTYFAGGCVRDEILGSQTQDIDITVELPEGGIRLAEQLYKIGIASQPILYKQFGTALITINNHKIELVMTRKESYRPRSRKPEVEYGTLNEDVMRRDFTVNSLLMRIGDAKILDLSGKGLQDIKAKLIRATSAPEIIFKEDPLRLLRAVRFATTLDFAIEKQTYKYIRHHASTLKHISRERIAEETIKILSSRNWLSGLALLNKTGLRSFIFPGLRIPASIYGLRTENLPLKIKLALLFYKAKDSVGFMKNLKLAAADVAYVQNLIRECKLTRTLAGKGRLTTEAALRQRAYELQPVSDVFAELYTLTGRLFPGNVDNYNSDNYLLSKISLAADQMRNHRFNLTGDDLILTFCIKSGPEVGELLVKGLKYWFAHQYASKIELLDYLEHKTKTKLRNK